MDGVIFRFVMYKKKRTQIFYFYLSEKFTSYIVPYAIDLITLALLVQQI